MSKSTINAKDTISAGGVFLLMGGVMAFGAARGFVESIKFTFDSATKPLTHFEPRRPEGLAEDDGRVQIYDEGLAWSLKVMGNGRVDKLVARLELTDIPQVDRKSQIWALSQSLAGITNLPQQEQLIKYGLNDSAVLSVARGIDLAAKRQLRQFSQEIPRTEWEQKPRTFIQGVFGAAGLKRVSTDEIVRDRKDFVDIIVKGTLESYSFHDRKDPASKDKLAEVVFDWLTKDVQPEVPDIFGDLKEPEFTPAYRPPAAQPQ